MNTKLHGVKPTKKLTQHAPDLLAMLKHILYEADHPDNQTDKELVEAIDWEGMRKLVKQAGGGKA